LVTLNIKVTDQRINLIEHGIDLAIRIGKLEDNQASLKQKKITQINRILVAGRTLLEANKPPRSPAELESWPWVGLTMLPYNRSMTNPEGKQIKITFQPSIFVDNVDAMTELAKQGIGLATPPDYLIEDALLSGEVIALLPKWKIAPIGVFAVWPVNTRKNSLSYFFIDFLQRQSSRIL
jgi:DNA-binding transcriptional LysR family regulator